MILGLDVGGTHTDTALVSPGGVARVVKTPTGSDLLETLTEALTRALETIPLVKLERMVFSTTLATNAVVQDRLDPVGMMVMAGPGIDPELYSVGPCYRTIPGVVDHRGKEVVPPDRRAVEGIREEMGWLGLDKVGVVGKFSVRHPGHEMSVRTWIKDHFSHVALGHRISGGLNFPRRIHTTYLNAALNDIHVEFVQSLQATLDRLGLDAPSYLLKPEGGTILMDRSFDQPAHTAQSGPAASVIGAIALHCTPQTSLVLDIGGTTTDMAVIMNSAPLLNPTGVRIGPYKTSIRSLYTCSIGVGGDSEVRIDKQGNLRVGPNRQGPPAAMGGSVPTPTDALVFLGKLKAGRASRACDAIEKLAQKIEKRPEETAERILEEAARVIAEGASQFIQEINSQPVYTIYELIEDRKVEPERVVLIGGPALCLAPYVQEALGLPAAVPKHYKAANAIGAACARVTTEINLHADTEMGKAVIPEEEFETSIGRDFTIENARAMAGERLKERALRQGANPEELQVTVCDEQVFGMVRDFQRVGTNIRLRAQITPGLTRKWMHELCEI